jgi:hypothetical protein
MTKDIEAKPDKVAWSIKNWCAATDLSPAYTYELLAAKRIDSVKVGGKRLITTAPRDFVASLAGEAA